MDKYLIPKPLPSYKSTFELLDEPLPEVQKSTAVVLGVLRHSTAAYWNTQTILDSLNPIVGELDQMPASVLVSSEGETSLYIQAWAERLRIPCSPLVADFTKLGKKAKFLRDSRILKESTHLLVFLGTRSDKNEKIAMKELKKGKRVFTVHPQSKELEEWIPG